MSTLTDTREAVETDFNLDDPDSLAHILHPRYTPAMLMSARVEGTSVEAWCGHKWVPSKDPKKLALCTKCKALHTMFDRRPLEYS